MDNKFDDLFEGDPFEHLIKILQNSSSKSLNNSINKLFEEYIIFSLFLEESGICIDEILSKKNIYKNKIDSEKINLAIKFMSDILSQE